MFLATRVYQNMYVPTQTVLDGGPDGVGGNVDSLTDFFLRPHAPCGPVVLVVVVPEGHKGVSVLR